MTLPPERVGVARRLHRLADADGVFVGLALDHRDSFRSFVRSATGGDVSDGSLRRMKTAIARVLAPHATAVMLDRELGNDALGALPPGVGLLMPLEAQGYEVMGDDRVTTLMEDFGPDEALRWGADACKLLVPFRADREATARRQEATVREAAEICHASGMPLVIEPVVYALREETDAVFRRRFPALARAAVERLRGLGADTFKLQFPVPDDVGTDHERAEEARRLCDEVSAILGEIPWVLLGGGTTPEEFEVRLRIAVGAGAIGFLVGRPLWGPAISESSPDLEDAALGSCRLALRRWSDIAREGRGSAARG